jgi:hypothetical protein
MQRAHIPVLTVLQAKVRIEAVCGEQYASVGVAECRKVWKKQGKNVASGKGGDARFMIQLAPNKKRGQPHVVSNARRHVLSVTCCVAIVR